MTNDDDCGPLDEPTPRPELARIKRNLAYRLAAQMLQMLAERSVEPHDVDARVGRSNDWAHNMIIGLAGGVLDGCDMRDMSDFATALGFEWEFSLVPLESEQSPSPQGDRE